MSNQPQDPKDMDIHFKDGVIRCKHCKATERTRWPIMVSEIMVIVKAIDDFKEKHTMCALVAHGHAPMP